jgi:hypothetical protein
MSNRRTAAAFAVALTMMTVAACQSSPRPAVEEQVPPPPVEEGPSPAEEPMEPAPAAAPGAPYVVEVVAEDYAFEAPDTIASGWVTFRLENAGEETHFLYLTHLAGGYTYDDYAGEVSPPIMEAMAAMRAGELDKAEAMEQLGTTIPAWYWENATSMGGPGLVAAGAVSQATVRLEPGDYVMECFMKTPEGEFHWAEGMIRPLTVSEEPSGAPEPSADLEIAIGAEDFEVVGAPTAGTHTVAVRFVDQPDVGFGNDMHVARLPDGVEASELVPWMDAFNVEGLQNPAPVPFLGGIQERPEGDVAYFTVDLEPGRYAWIAESPDVLGLAREFVISP